MCAKKSRTWMFVINNYTDNDIQKVLTLSNDSKVRYCIVGKEIAPSTNTPHLQGYVRFVDAKTRRTVSKKIPRARLQIAVAGDEKNMKYCSKDNNLLVETGKPSEQGKRTDLDDIKKMILDGEKTLIDIQFECTNYQQMKMAETLYKGYNSTKKRTHETKIIWIYGPSGSGKSQWVAKKYPDAWWSGENGNWFEGYDNQKVAVFDDFRADFCKFHVLLRLANGVPYTVNIKGSSRQWLPETICITTPYSPLEIYKNRTDEDLYQLIRRIKKLLHISGENCTEEIDINLLWENHKKCRLEQKSPVIIGRQPEGDFLDSLKKFNRYEGCRLTKVVKNEK